MSNDSNDIDLDRVISNDEDFVEDICIVPYNVTEKGYDLKACCCVVYIVDAGCVEILNFFCIMKLVVCNVLNSAPDDDGGNFCCLLKFLVPPTKAILDDTLIPTGDMDHNAPASLSSEEGSI